MQWELKQVGDTEWIQDDSGYYTLIHHVKDDIVRLDFMDKDDMPVVSFQGTADNVRKCAMQNLPILLQPEHCSYIGAELARAAILRNKYVQD